MPPAPAFAAPAPLPLRHSPSPRPTLSPLRRPNMVLPPPPQVGDLPTLAAAHLLAAARTALAARGAFTVAISGGSLPSQLAAGLAARPGDLAAAEPERWTVLLADERLVLHADEDSNYRLICEELPVLKSRLLSVDERLVAGEIGAAAEAYGKVVGDALEESGGVFDAVYLGLGPDGHTASLFPGGGLLEDGGPDGGKEGYVAGVSDSPKPPPRRVTLTLGVLNAAREVAFVVGGAGKKPVVREIMEVEGCGLPGARVRPDLKGGRLEWFLDEAAAAGLSGRGGKL